MKEPRQSVARVLLGGLAASSVLLGVWALVAPQGFYDTFPGAGRHWVSVNGPFNEHFVRDFGALNLALASLLLVAAVRFQPTLVRTAAVAALLYGLPHFAYHLAHLDVYETLSDQIGNVVSLGLAVLAPLAVLFLARPAETS
jgi:hypothetical protein